MRYCMNLFDYAVEFHSLIERKGPGSREETLRALRSVPDVKNIFNILVIGCATGEEAFILAQNTDANIVAIDIIPAFLDELREKADKNGLANRISARLQSMDNLDYLPNKFDLVWVENSISHIGFERGLKEWHKYIKSGGHIVLSDICWLTDERDGQIKDFCEKFSKDIDTVISKRSLLGKYGIELEIDMYMKYKSYYGAAFFIAKVIK